MIDSELVRPHDCLTCGHSYSDDAPDGTMILRCEMKDWVVVSDDGWCKDIEGGE